MTSRHDGPVLNASDSSARIHDPEDQNGVVESVHDTILLAAARSPVLIRLGR
jgi:hypothetical protein